MPDAPTSRPLTASTMWVVAIRSDVLLRMLADGSVVVDGRNGRIGLRLEFSPQPLPAETDDFDAD